MENMETIVTNEEVIETTADLAQAGLSKGFKVGLGVGLAVLTGGLAYKFIIKPVMTKIKSQRELAAETDDFEPPIEGEVIEFEKNDSSDR